MPERIAKVAQEYGQRRIKVGELFQVEPQHVDVLLRVGHIEPEEGELGYVVRDLNPGAAGVYQTRDMATERTKRPYRRKGAAQ